MKLCKDCTHFRSGWDCWHPRVHAGSVVTVSLVDGKKEARRFIRGDSYTNGAAHIQRNAKFDGPDRCGPAGRWFEARLLVIEDAGV